MTENSTQKVNKTTGKLIFKKPFRLALIAVIVVLGAVVIMRRSFTKSGDSNNSSELYTVTRDDLTISVTESGDIKALNSTDLKSKVEGKTTIISIVDEGYNITAEDVNNGKVLCELDSSDIKEKLTQQEITFLKADASFTEAKEALDIRKKQNESDIQAGKRKVKFALMDFKKYLGEIVAQQVIVDTNHAPNFDLDMTQCLDYLELGGEASQKLKELADDINLADSKLKRAASMLEGSKKLYEADYIAKTELEADELTVQSFEVQKKRAQIALQLFKLYEFPKQAEQLLGDYYEAGRELERINASASSKLAQAQADLDSKKATYSLQKEKLEKLQKQFNACIIKAPAVGQVVYSSSMLNQWHRQRRLIEVGATVRERQKIISIPDLSKMKVEVKVHEMWIDKVQLNQKAKIKVSAFSDETFTGKVIRRAPLAEQTNQWGSAAKVYTTDIGIDGTHDFLKTGMTAEVEIIVDELKDVLIVPIQAVTNHNGKKICLVESGRSNEQRQVQTGLFNEDFVEIKGGLKKGEKILLNPSRLTKLDSGEKEPKQKSKGSGEAAEKSGTEQRSRRQRGR